jgi:hypothetical protein
MAAAVFVGTVVRRKLFVEGDTEICNSSSMKTKRYSVSYYSILGQVLEVFLHPQMPRIRYNMCSQPMLLRTPRDQEQFSVLRD